MNMNKKQKKMLRRILIAAVLVVLLRFVPAQGMLRFALYMLPYAIIGYDILLDAVRGVRNRQPFDENFLMAVATVGAIALDDYTEGVAVMLFYQIGELFQSVAVGKSRRSISALMDIRPDYANLEDENGDTEQVDPDEVAVGRVIVVRPGEKIPIDGTVVEGRAALDTSALTGESLPREAQEGDEVISGCISLNGVLRIRTTREFGESTVSRVLEMVENASSRKSRPENFITQFARIYTPAVCYGAVALAVLPPVIRLMLGMEVQAGEWVLRALTFLVISCPCALVVSIPMSFFAGIGCASREGVLVKGSNYLEQLSKTRCVVFDKTGTMTRGVFEVTQVCPAGMEAKRLIELAALAESYTTHPIGLSLQKAYAMQTRGAQQADIAAKYQLVQPVDRARVSDVQEISGHGVTACVDGVQVAAGNERLMQRLGIAVQPCEADGTVVYVAADGAYAGAIVIADQLKPGAKEAVDELRRAGVRRIVMLTGDRQEAAQRAAAQLGISEVHSGLLPGDKVDRVEEILAAKAQGEGVAFVGDGINDAPVLSRADIGIAMGALGSDAAIEAADVVLMDDDPRRIAQAIAISRKCLGIVYQNIVFAIGVKVICLLLGALGLAGMWAAIFADVGVMVLAVLNALRAMRAPKA